MVFLTAIPAIWGILTKSFSISLQLGKPWCRILVSETSLLSRTPAWRGSPLPDSAQLLEHHQLHNWCSQSLLTPQLSESCLATPFVILHKGPDSRWDLIWAPNTWNHNRRCTWTYTYSSVYLVHYIYLPSSICEVDCSSQNAVFKLSWITSYFYPKRIVFDKLIFKSSRIL